MFGFARFERASFRRTKFGEVARQVFEIGLAVGAAHRDLGPRDRRRALDAHARLAGAIRRRGADSGRAWRLRSSARRARSPPALLVAGRVGAGIGAELGAMKVTEQIDALEAVAVDSFKYLAVTRIVACVIAMPMLTTVMNFAGIIGGFLAETAITRHVLAAVLSTARSR